jgi:hypothetical protein
MQLRHVLAYYAYAAIHNLAIYEFSTKLKLGFSEKGTHLREIILNGRDRKLERLAVCGNDDSAKAQPGCHLNCLHHNICL